MNAKIHDEQNIKSLSKIGLDPEHQQFISFHLTPFLAVAMGRSGGRVMSNEDSQCKVKVILGSWSQKAWAIVI